MQVISEQIVDDAWQAVGNYSGDQAQAHMERIGKEQPHLLAFVMAATEPFSEDAQELGVYLMVVTHGIFEKASGQKLGPVKPERIEAIYEQLEELAAEFEDSDDDEEDEPAGGLPTTQPYVMQYVVDALTEIQDDAEDEELSDDDVGGLFLVMKTVVDALDEVAA